MRMFGRASVTLVLVALGFVLLSVAAAQQQPTPVAPPDTVVIPSGDLRLTGLLWKPAGSSSFPAILFSHGGGRTDPARAHDIGPVFAKHGYAFLYLFRR